MRKKKQAGNEIITGSEWDIHRLKMGYSQTED
jgi:hypothetical protein